jgi:porin
MACPRQSNLQFSTRILQPICVNQKPTITAPARARASAVVGAIALLWIAAGNTARAADPGFQAAVGDGPASATAPRPQLSAPGSAETNAGWWSTCQRLVQAGITPGAALVLEGFRNFRGGLNDSRFEGALTFDLSLLFDLEKLCGWQGGKFYVDLEDHAGKNPSADLVGDLQLFDKQNASPYLKVFELWYEQQLFEGKLRFKAGKVDANTEFSVNDNGQPFLNSSSQLSPTLFVLPTTPAPMPGLNVFFTPIEPVYAGVGAYYANRSATFGDFTGYSQNAQAPGSGAFLISEIGLRWPRAPARERGGTWKLGVWRHTGTFTRFDGSPQSGAVGIYSLLNQTLWQPAGEPPSGRGWRAFLEFGSTQETVHTIDGHAGGGLTWTGPAAARPEDILGFGLQYAHLSAPAGLPRSYEMAVEAFYRLELTRWARFTPDLQYIINPGGKYSNALVATLRLMVHF